MAYSYYVAKDCLNENDKNRLLCLYLNCDPTAINWDKATEEYGAASVDSMRVSTRNVLKKIEKAGGKVGAEGSSSGVKPPATSKAGTGGGTKRKKAQAEIDDDGDGDSNGDDGVGYKSKAKRGRKKVTDERPSGGAAEVKEEDESGD